MSTGIPMPQDESVEPAAPIQAESAESATVSTEEPQSTVVTELEVQADENVTAFSMPNFGDEPAEDSTEEVASSVTTVAGSVLSA